MLNKKTFKYILGIFMILALSISIFGCAPTTQPVDPGEAAEEPWKIGVILPLSGPVAGIANFELEGRLIAQKLINEAGGIHGRQIELIIEDDQANPTMTIAAARQLIERDNVIVISGPLLTTFGLAVIPTIEEMEVPNINHGAGVQIVDPVNKWVFKVPHTDTLIIREQLNFLSNEKGVSKFAVFHQDDASGVSGGAQLIELAAEYGLEVVIVEEFTGTDTDMRSQLLRIDRSGAEAIAIVGFADPIGVIAKNAREVGIDIPMVGSHGAVSAQFIAVAGEAGEGMYFIGVKSIIGEYLDSDDPHKEWYDMIMPHLDTDFDIFHGNGFDSMFLIAEAIKRAGPNANRSSLRDAFEEIQNHVLLNAPYSFSPSDHDGPGPESLVPLIVKDGKFIPAL